VRRFFVRDPDGNVISIVSHRDHQYVGSNVCRLAQITATTPGLFLTSDPDTADLRIGLQFATAELQPGMDGRQPARHQQR
jgi:hypothetical protein